VVPDVPDEVVDQAAAQPATLGTRRPQGGDVDGRLRMPVNPTVLAVLGSRLPRLTEAT
jgi:hypothetical protein